MEREREGTVALIGYYKGSSRRKGRECVWYCKVQSTSLRGNMLLQNFSEILFQVLLK